MAAKKQQHLSISKLAMRFSLDRATVRKRLLEAEIEPTSVSAKETLYALNEELEQALLAQTRPIDAAKLRKETAEAELREIKLAEAKSETCSVADFTAVTQSIFGNLHKKCCVQQPKKLARKLAKAKSEAEIARILAKEYGLIFEDLRKNYKNFLDKKIIAG